VVETDRDHYLGRLDLRLAGKKVADFAWTPIAVDDAVEPDPAMAALVAQAEEDFVTGSDGHVKRHTFMPGGYCAPPPTGCGNVATKGLQLTEDLDAVVGYVAGDTVLRRRDVLEEVLNNLAADALRAASGEVAAVDLAVTNGYRFGTAVLPGSPILLRDLFTWYPIAAAVSVAEYSGSTLQRTWDDVLSKVFNRNPFLQQGGWYLGFSSNFAQTIDLDHRPFSSSSGRIVESRIDGQPVDPSKRYVMASCYAHGDPLGTICRTDGGANVSFPALTNIDDYTSPLLSFGPLNDESIIVGTAVKQVAPDAFLHPAHALYRYLRNPDGTVKTVSGADHALGRVQTVDSTQPGNPAVPPPVAEPDPTLVQPPQGAGPMFFSGRIGGE
jgi:2',3'-cyclic-nucleotide 2'-phosphodiesterase (5'-nucleotidase family)